MKPRRSDVRCKAHAIPELRFENQSLTPFAGLVLVQQFFACIDLKVRLRGCFRHLSGTVFGRATIFDAVVQTRRFSGSGLCGGPQVVCCGKGAGRWWLIETLAGRGRGGFRLGERKTSAGRPYAAWRVASRAARIQRRMLRAMNLSFTVRSTAGWPRTRRRPPP